MYQADGTPCDHPKDVMVWKVWNGVAWEVQETVRVEEATLRVSGTFGDWGDIIFNGMWQRHGDFNGFPSWQKIGNTKAMLARVSLGWSKHTCIRPTTRSITPPSKCRPGRSGVAPLLRSRKP
mmetsp:Transcript_157179/g.501185  ORF Transcript_157179/g.501185 Transcript_157179/m.501185 type:complete len:122 (-) Transcript_157179:146-511(-)